MIKRSVTGRQQLRHHIASVGVVSEYWFGEMRFDGRKANRHSWGPVVRFRAPLQ